MGTDAVFIVTLALGLTVVPAIALSPLYANRLRVVRSARLGAALVFLAFGIGLVTAATPEAMASSRNALFLCAFVLLLLGALILLYPRDDPDDPPHSADDEPPWWPEFEAALRLYAQQSRRRPVPRR